MGDFFLTRMKDFWLRCVLSSEASMEERVIRGFGSKAEIEDQAEQNNQQDTETAGVGLGAGAGDSNAKF